MKTLMEIEILLNITKTIQFVIFQVFFHFNVSNRSNPSYPEFQAPILIESFTLIVLKSNQNRTEKALIEFFDFPYIRKFLNFHENFQKFQNLM